MGVDLISFKTKCPFLSLSDTCQLFYNTAPSPSGPSGIHCDLKPDTDNTTSVTERGFPIFPSLFSPSALIYNSVS